MIVYLAFCTVTKKGYVGQTTLSLLERWAQHCKDARNRSSFLLHKAIRKYGEESFELSVLEVTDILPSLCSLEIEQIKKQNTKAPFGYNMTDGGDKPPSRKGKKLSIDTKLKMRIVKLGKHLGGIKKGTKIFPHSKTHKEKLSQAMQGNINGKRTWFTSINNPKNKL